MIGSRVAFAAEAQPSTVQDNVQVTLAYTLTVDGEIVDRSSDERPFQFVQGRKQIIPGLEQELAGMAVGESKQVTVAPALGYGNVDPRAFVEIPKSQLPEGDPQVGMVLRGKRPDGGAFAGRIKEVHADNVVLDLNHPLAGKTLHFNVTVTGLSPAPASQ